MKSLLMHLQVELLKAKNSFAFLLTGLGAAFVPVFWLLHHIYDWKKFIPESGENPWFEYLRKGMNGVHFTFLPLFIVLLAVLLLNIEHKSNTWKHIFVQPVSKSKIFLGKYLVFFCLIIAFYFVLLALLVAGAEGLWIWKHELMFGEYSPSYHYAGVGSPIIAFVIRSFVSTLAVAAIHFWLSFRLKNLFLNIGIGLAGVVIAVSIYIPHWPTIIYFPYAYPVLMCNFVPDQYSFLSDFHVNSLVCFGVVSLCSYLDFTRLFRG